MKILYKDTVTNVLLDRKQDWRLLDLVFIKVMIARGLQGPTTDYELLREDGTLVDMNLRTSNAHELTDADTLILRQKNAPARETS